MNAHTNLTAQFEARRRAEDMATRENIRRLIDRLEKCAAHPRDDFAWLQAFDAARFVFENVDFTDDIEDARFELRLDEDGFPIDPEWGYTIPDADRVWFPCERILPVMP